ncbi:MAG TPA: acyl-CoA dehydrogenase family protein [Candidatus Thermoplasmatota archaeon]|nr:acyl-CoA dehydrogenase family protein [Candidatus Thermoplasmatota archaeon]
MDFGFTEEQQAIRKTAREFAEQHFPPIAMECDANERFPRELVPKLAALGFLGISLDPKYGGAGLGVVEQSLVMEEFARVDGGIAVAVWSTAFGSEILQALGSDALKQQYLPPLTKGEAIMGAAITEPEAGSDVANISTVARKDGKDWVISGQKIFITNGTIADYFVMICATDPTNPERHRRHSSILVPAKSAGLKAQKMHGKMGIRASDTAELYLEDVRVPQANTLGKEGEGFLHVMQFFNQTRIGVAAQAVGIAQGALERATKYAQERKAFGQPISEFQAIQFKLAEMATKTEAARNLMYKAAWEVDRRRPNPMASSMAKWYAGQVAVEVCDEALQIHGGYGYMKDFDVERFYRDAKITELYEGTKEVHKLIIARALLGKLRA